MNNIIWQKKGIIIKPLKNCFFSKTHAMIPTPYKIEKGIYKILYSGRNKINQSYITSATIDLNKDFKIIKRDLKPILSPGKLGTFDDNGVTPSCLIQINSNELALYYIGWNPGSTTRMNIFGGLAISNDKGKTFHRWSEAPIIERNKFNQYINTAPWVIKNPNSKGFMMYYVSGIEWINKDLPRYNIKVAESNDGKYWNHKNSVCINFQNDKENALARPYVFHENNIWKMFFSYKGNAYRIGYAESNNGFDWTRHDDKINFKKSNHKFDNIMMEYASVIKFNNQYHMFYNGNNYGYEGIGYAIGSNI